MRLLRRGIDENGSRNGGEHVCSSRSVQCERWTREKRSQMSTESDDALRGLKARTTACQPEQRAEGNEGRCAKGQNQGALITQPPVDNQRSSANATRIERKRTTAASSERRGKVIGAEVRRVESILSRKSVSAVEDKVQLN